MKGGDQLVLVLLLAGIVCCTAGSHWNYNYFRLVTVWPNSYCIINEDTCREDVLQYFTIAGLWPMRGRSMQEPRYCLPTYRLEDKVMKTYKDDLLKYWPDLSTSNFEESMDTWRDQWKIHGSCSDGPMRPKKYISTALDRMRVYNLTTILSNAGITPNGRSYPTWKILQAIQEATGFQVDIFCDKKDGEEVYYLTKIHQCLDYNGRKFRNCNNHAYNCTKRPIFPKLEPESLQMNPNAPLPGP